MSSNEQMKNVKDGAVARSSEGSMKQFGMEKTNTLSPRKPKNSAKPPKFRMEKAALAAAAQTSQFEAEVSSKLQQQAAAPKPAMKRLERLGKFRSRSGHMDVDLTTLRV
ncbi:hypothetical protein MPTK1_6g15110 [Marchantia polymorpha subsp. ruderalis]|nr:hypothetical protein MARPO_0056s0022 [Marchantia polymorpha]BBN14861.1 hypothetical protein Mp_6g15110 [Marchantia polymorpha subsp. ruderalis]|eukprot:PTQ37543.1 hypothetical protein MARPO_0056s0022 [Marchantia polymorpha]